MLRKNARRGAAAALLVIGSTVTLTMVSCVGGDDSPPGAGGTTGTPRPFRSDTLLPLSVTTLSTCETLKSASNPSARRPMCAQTYFQDSSSDPTCLITGLKPGCACYEGQAHACDQMTGGPCTSGTDCGVKECVVIDDAHSSWSACKTAPVPPAGAAGAAGLVVGFRSDTTLPLSVTTLTNCETLQSAANPSGRRPLCAVTTFDSSSNPPKCPITGLNSGCACYEGQAHACSRGTGGPCIGGGDVCGVRKCIVTSDNASTWSRCTTAP